MVRCKSCKKEAKKALKYEGDTALETSFQILGQVAGQELFASPAVAGAMSGLQEHMDEKKLEALRDGE